MNKNNILGLESILVQIPLNHEKFANQMKTSRREAMKLIAAGSTVGLMSLFESPLARAEKHETPAYAKVWLL